MGKATKVLDKSTLRPYSPHMGNTLAIHWSVTTHGTWLHGDPRGSWLNGRLIGPDPFLQADIRARMRNDAVILRAAERAIIAEVLGKTMREQQHRILAATIQPTHMHLVFAPVRENLKTVIARFKWRTAAAVLKQRREEYARNAAAGTAGRSSNPAGTAGHSLNSAGTAGLYSRAVPARTAPPKSLWTAGRFPIFIFTEYHLVNAIEYVRDHNRRAKLPADPFAWIDPLFPPAELAGERCYPSDAYEEPRVF